jgi:hypothetical protein
VNAARFNQHIDTGRAKAEGQLQALERGYRITLQAAARHAGDRFAALATDHLTADATDPKWTPPENDQLIDPAGMAADAQKRTQPARHAALKAVMALVLTDVGIAYDLTNPLIAGLVDKLGVRAADMGDAIRGDVAKAVLNAYQQGLSVANTAKGIQAAVEGIAPARAAMLARTDLIGLANGASVAAAQLVAGSDSEGGLGFKQWLATEDERTRESHAEADGQIVPLEQTFTVGSDQLAYPGDPDGSDEEVCNCRCTVVYLSASEAAGDVTASMQAPTGDVTSAGRMDESPNATIPAEIAERIAERLTAAITVTVDGDAQAEEAAEMSVVPTRWRAILCIEGQDTQDSATLIRRLREGTTTWRGLPLPLGVIFQTPHSDEVNAEVCGLIDTIYRDESDFRVIWGEGAFNADEVGMHAASEVANLSLRGVSIDPYVPEVQITELTPETDTSPAKMLVEMIDAVICAATICPVQAIDGAQITLLASGEGDDIMPLRSASCFVLTVEKPAPMAELVADGWSPRIDELAARLEDIAAAVATAERARVDETRDLRALVAAAVEEASVPKKLLTDIGVSLTSLSEEITRKPRTVEFVRDADGKLAGTREG